MISAPLFGLVLSGGRSSRMGKDKGLLTFHEKPQREYLFDLLSRYCSKVFTSCREEQQVPVELNPLVDSFDLHGPMNGILSAFKKSNNTAWLIVAVDMPYVDGAVLELLLSQRNIQKVATCFYNTEENFPEPLLTIWEPDAYPLLVQFVEKGKVSPRDFLQSHSVQLVEPLDKNIFTNINYPGQLPL